MKKLFTLLVGVMMTGSAFGQSSWKNVVTNSDMEGTAPAYSVREENQADAWNSFWVHEWPGDQSVRYDGTATIAEDPADPSNHVAKIVVRSRAEGEAAGNLTKDYTGNDGTYGSWDCQFFIYSTEPIPAGKEIRLKMRVKADRAGYFESQAHSLPGDYIDQSLFGNINYTTEWTDYTSDVLIVSETQGNGNFQSVAFNLCTDEEANVIYFDDIKLQIRDVKEETGEVSWINFMRKGIYSNDSIKGSSSQGDFACTNFTVQTPAGVFQAPIVEVPGEPGVMAVQVPVLGYYSKEVENLDEEGNQQYDEEGNILMQTLYFWNNGDTIGTSTPNRYAHQFFVSTLHKMKARERYIFKFRAKADKPGNLATQAHYGPTQYASYNTFGDESAFAIGTDWTTFDLGEAQGQTIPSGANNCQTICFDCVPQVGEDNNFYFIFEECSFTEANVTIEDRTLGTPQDLPLAVNLDDDEMANTVDMADMLNTFEVEDFSFLNNPKDGIKLFAQIQPEDSEDDPIETFSGLLPWVDGGFINAKGYYIDEEDGINIRLDDESIDGTKINVMVWNNPDSGISFDNGETVSTKLAISQSGWYYIYNVTLSKDGTQTGIKDIQATKNDKVIYDLMGRKVTKMDKGIYIVNGKKYIVK